MTRLIFAMLLLVSYIQPAWRIEQQYGQRSIEDAAWLPDGHTLAAVGPQGIWLYDGADLSAPPRLLETAYGWIHRVVAGGDVLATGHEDGSVTIWRSNDLSEIGRLERAAMGAIEHLELSQDGTRLVAGGLYGPVRVWDVAQRTVLMTIEVGDMDATFQVALSADGRRLAVSTGYLSADAGGPAFLQIWDVDQQQMLRTPNEGLHSGTVALSNDGRWLVLMSAAEGTRLWDAENHGFAGPSGFWDEGSAAAFSADGQRLVFAGFGLSVWDVATWTRVTRVEPEEPVYAASPLSIGDDHVALVGTDAAGSRGLWAWNLSTGERTQLAITETLTGVFLAGDRIVGRYAIPERFGSATFRWLADGQAVEAPAQAMLSPDGRWLAWLDEDGLNLRDLESEAEQAVAVGISEGEPLLAFSPDSHLLAVSATESESIAVVDVSAAQPVTTLNIRLPHDLAWSATHLAASSTYGVSLWPLDSWQKTSIRPADPYYFNASGVQLASDRIVAWDRPEPGFEDFTGFRLYMAELDDAEFSELHSPEIPTAFDLALSPDESTIAVAAGDGHVHLLALDTGREVASLETQQGNPQSVLYLPDGRLVVATEGGLIQIWTVG